MATATDKIVRVPQSNEDEIITAINNNFKILTERIKNQNLKFSYLDMLRIAKIFRYPGSDSSEAYKEFISTTWSILDNYSGVYLSFVDEAVKITMGGQTAGNGDYLVKLPGGEFLYIPGTNPLIYQPSPSAGDPFQITYNLVNTKSPDFPPTITFSLPNMMSNHTSLTTASVSANSYIYPFSSATINNNLRDVRWYTSEGEEVLWDNSYHTCKNITNMPLTVSYILIN